MNSNKNKKGDYHELYRICPSKLTKHELEDLYFTVLESNMQLRKTINEQEEKIRRLSSQMQRKYSAQKVLQAEERNNCCVSTNIKVKQQKDSLDKLRREHDKTARRIRNLSIKLSSENTSRPYPPSYSKTASKLIRYTPSTLKQHNMTANYKVSEDKGRFSPCAIKPRSQSKACALTGKESKNNKRRGSIGTLTELLRDQKYSATQTEPPCCNKTLLSTEFQTDLQSCNKESLSAESQTEMQSNKTSLPVEIQTDLPREKILQHTGTQTELLRDQTAETQTDMPRDDTSETSSIQTQTAQEKDGNNMRRDEITSNQTQTAPENSNANKFYAIEYREDTLCNENKCRTLMDELRQKVNNLVEELAKTHNKYSTRISRLEVEVQEYRNENMHIRLGHPVTEYEATTCGSFTRLLLNNLRTAELYSADLKMQLAIEKKKVNELLSLIRGAKMRHRLPKDVAMELDAKKSKMNLDHNDCTIHYNCDSDCPIANISSKHKCTAYNHCKRGQNSPRCRAHDSPLNSIDFEDNSQNQPPDLQSQNASPDFPKYTPNFKENQNRPDIKINCDTNIKINNDLPIPSAKLKGLCNIYSNNTPNRPSAPDALFKEGGVVSNVNNTQALTKSGNLTGGNQDVLRRSDKFTHQYDHIGIPKAYEADSGKDLPDCNNLNKIQNLHDGVHSLGVPEEVCLNDNNRNLGNNNTISNYKNEQEEVYDANLDQNNIDDNKQPFQPNRKMSSDAFESLDKPSMLVKSLIDINEEQSKTVGELVRQINVSQRSMQTTLINDDDFQPNDPRDLTKERTNMILPQDTTGLMRVRSTHADDVISNVQNTTDEENNNNRQRSMQSLDKYGPINSSELRVPEIFPNSSTFSKTQHDEVPSQKADTERIKPPVSQQIPGGKPSSGPYEKRCKAPNANIPAPVDTQNTNKVDPENDINRLTELEPKYNTVLRNIQNVPTKDTDSILKETIPSPETSGSVTIKAESKCQGTSMNNIYEQTGGNTNLLKPFKTSDKNIQVKIKRPEKLEIRNDFKDTNTNTTPTQLEIETYRRNSGTLCFKTVPVSKRSQHCQCTEQLHCEGIKFKGTQTEKEIEKASKNTQGTCTTGCSKCTRNFARKNMEIQKTGNVTGYSIAPESTSTYYSRNAAPKNETQLANTVPGGLANNNMTNKEEAVTNNANPRLSDGGPYQNNNSWRLLSRTPEPTARMQERLNAIAEELLRVKKQLSEARTTSVLLEATERIQTNLENKPSDEVVSEFDAGRRYVLKPGMAMHTMNENNTAKCVFVLHIGTVVLSDEAVLISRGKSLALTWKFYDQDTNMTQMRAGRVVVFDFSTEYDLRLTDEFLNYMKHDELHIIICELEEPNKTIASCSLPLRDALLNTNRRADMSLALVAGPQLVYARQANHVASDNLDSSDEMGVLDLWCMLRVEGQFLPRINKAIAGDLRIQAPDILSDSKRERPIIEPEPSKTEAIKLPEEIRPADDGICTLRRWGSSTLRLPSKDLSKDRSMETRSGEGEDWAELQDDQASFFSSAGGSKHTDSIGLKTATTAEVDNGLTSRPRKSYSDHKRRSKIKQDAGPSRVNKSTAVPNDFQDDYPAGILVNEVIANIKTSDDMKRVLNRPCHHPVSILAQEPDAPSQVLGSGPSFVSKLMPDDIFKNKKSDISQEPSVVLPRTSTNKRSEMINQKYQDIVNLYPRSNSQKVEGCRLEQSRKQVTIASHKRRQSHVNEKPEQDIPEEDEHIIEITVLWLALNEECEAMLNPRVQRVYVAYEFLGRSGADLETPVSLPKPKHYVDKCYFNFKKSFEIDKKDMPLLGQLARCRATSVSQVNKAHNDCVVFTVISEPPEDPLGLEICEDIGYAYLFLGDLLAYSNGSSGYTEVIPVRSRTGTSVCGVLAVRLDGLDVLRESLALVDRMLDGTQNRQA